MVAFGYHLLFYIGLRDCFAARIYDILRSYLTDGKGGGYKKELVLPGDVKQRIFLQFDGVMSSARV